MLLNDKFYKQRYKDVQDRASIKNSFFAYKDKISKLADYAGPDGAAGQLSERARNYIAARSKPDNAMSK